MASQEPITVDSLFFRSSGKVALDICNMAVLLSSMLVGHLVQARNNASTIVNLDDFFYSLGFVTYNAVTGLIQYFSAWMKRPERTGLAMCLPYFVHFSSSWINI